jgi:hypothetical protein
MCWLGLGTDSTVDVTERVLLGFWPAWSACHADDEAVLIYLHEFRQFEAAHRGMIQAMTGRGTVQGITAADVARKQALTRLRNAWRPLTDEEQIGLQPPPSTG